MLSTQSISRFAAPKSVAVTLSSTLAAAAVLMVGCSQSPIDTATTFEPNLIHAMKYEIKEGFSMDQALADTNWIIDGMFGTPDEPKIPELFNDDDFEGLIALDRLQKAAGATGLYRKHCANCHGVTGNGRGQLAAIQDPYPRDYRHGIFKFKSTKRGSKPVREDLARLIRNGIAGTSMNKIPGLTEDDVQALVDYVIYLSMRGELERTLMDDAIFELDLEGGDRIVDSDLGKIIAEVGSEQQDPEEVELFEESMEIAEDLLADIGDAWLEAEDDVVEVPSPPEDIPVANSHTEFVSLLNGDQSEALATSIERGRAVFTGKVASCSKCHGEKGLGDGQKTDYDDWTKDWTTRAGLKPEDYDSLVPLIARGALPPKNALPRNFSEGIFRGGEAAEDLYRRMSQGIEGSPMPASTFVPDQYEKEDIWHVINFIRSLQPIEEPVAVTEG